MRFSSGLIVLFALVCGGCDGAAQKRQEELASLRAQVIAKDVEIGTLRAERAKLKEAAETAATTPRQERVPKFKALREASAAPNEDMCYKDYCPCDPPQGGPDTVLCDQLEEGIPVQIDLLIAGRGMREARRQIAEHDY